MPSVTITISAWWLVAIVAQVAWLFVFGRAYQATIWKLRRRYGWRNSPNWVNPLGYALAGPAGWVGAIWDVVETRRSARRSRRRRSFAAHSTSEER